MNHPIPEPQDPYHQIASSIAEDLSADGIIVRRLPASNGEIVLNLQDRKTLHKASIAIQSYYNPLDDNEIAQEVSAYVNEAMKRLEAGGGEWEER